MPRFTPGCCCTTTCILASDDFGDGSLASYTQLVGTWTEASGVVSPDTSTSDQRLRYDGLSLPVTADYLNVTSVRIRGDTGDRAGIMLYDDANNYIEATVRFGSGTFGRLNFNHVSGGAVVFTWNAELECSANEYDIPPNEWVTLTLKVDDVSCNTFGIVNVILEVDDTAETHTLGASLDSPLPSPSKVGLTTGSSSLAIDFDDLSIEAGSQTLTGACDPVIHCCVSAMADETGHGDTGWTITSGDWTDDSVGNGVATEDITAKRTIDYTWLNDNLIAQFSIGPIGGGSGSSYQITETVWRYYFSVHTSNDWWLEMRLIVVDWVSSVDWYALMTSLKNDGVIQAWMLQVLFPVDAVVTVSPEITANVFDCMVQFTSSAGAGPVWWSESGGVEAEEFLAYSGAFTLCVDDNDLNRTGKVGLGTGNVVDNANFFGPAGVLVSCSAEFTCDAPAGEDPPEDPDPGDPTGCCDDFSGMQTGDPIELTLSSWAYWFGAGCADPGCVDSGFLATFNATHTLTLVYKDADRMVFVGNLPENSCDECEGITINASEGTVVRLHNRAVLEIEPVDETTCIAKVWIYGRCEVCQWYFEGEFSPGDCSGTITMTLVSGNATPGGYDCCLQAGDVSFALP